MPGPPSPSQHTSRVIPGSPELSLKTQHSSAGHSPWERNLSTEPQRQLLPCTQGLKTGNGSPENHHLKTDGQLSAQEMNRERRRHNIPKLARVLWRASPCRMLPRLGNSEGRETTPDWPRPPPACTPQSIVRQHRKRSTYYTDATKSKNQRLHLVPC